MSTLTWYLKDAVPSGATLHRSLSESTSGISAAVTSTGWTVGTNVANKTALQNGGSKVAAATFSVTLFPQVGPSQTVGDCWRTENAYTGGFDSATVWSFTFGLESVTLADTGTLRLRVRVWHSTDANGVGATEWTGSTQTTTTVGPLTLVGTTSLTLTWTPAAQLGLRPQGEYIFIQVACETVTAGSGATDDALLCVDTTKFSIAATDYVAQAGARASHLGKNTVQLSYVIAATPGQALTNKRTAVPNRSYMAPYITYPVTGSAMPAMLSPQVDTQGTLSGIAEVNSVVYPYARIALYYRPTGALVNVATADVNGAFTFYGLNRNVVSDKSFYAVMVDPNGLPTQYNSKILDRLIPG